MAVKAKNTPEADFPGGRCVCVCACVCVCVCGGGGGSGVRDMALPSLGNLRAKFSETSFPHFKTCFTQIGRCYLYTPILKNV